VLLEVSLTADPMRFFSVNDSSLQVAITTTTMTITITTTTATNMTPGYENHTQLPLVLFSQILTAVEHHKANDTVVYVIRVWFNYDTALSEVVLL